MENLSDIRNNLYIKSKGLDILNVNLSELSTGKTSSYCSIYGDHLNRPLFHIENGLIGFERIFYKVTYTEQENSKFPKRPSYIRGYKGEKTPAYTPIGSIENSKKIYIVGGWADAVTVSNALNDPESCVLGIQGERNTPKLVSQIKRIYPVQEIIVCLDGDITGISCAIESNTKFKNAPYGGDWNDLYLDKGLDAVRKELETLNDPLPVYSIKQIKSQDSENEPSSLKDAKSLFRVCLKSLKEIPEVFNSLTDAVNTHKKSYPLVRKETTDAIIKYILRILSSEKKDALDFLNITDDENLIENYKVIPNLTDTDTKELFTQEGVHLLSAPHGCGKTEHVGKYLIDNSDGRQTMFLCHLKTLTADASKRLGMANYSEMKDTIKERLYYLNEDLYTALDAEKANYSKVGFCINSIVLDLKGWVEKTKIVLIDEVSQVIRMICSASLENFENEKVFNELKSIVRNALIVVAMDSDLNDDVVEFTALARGEKVNVYVMPRPKVREDVTLDWCFGSVVEDGKKITSTAVAEQRLFHLLKENKKVGIACDSKSKTDAINDFILKHFPGKRILLVNRDTTNRAEQRAFLTSPDLKSKDYDVIVYSPSMRSGVSIVNPEFADVIGVFSGTTITSMDAIQMICRFRQAKNIGVFVEEKNINAVIETQKTIEEIQIKLSGKCLSEFDKFANKVKLKEYKNKNKFSKNLFYQLEAYGYKINRINERNPFESEIDMIVKANAEKHKESLLNAMDLTDGEYVTLSRQEDKSYADLLAIEAHKIKRFFNVRALSNEILELWNDGRNAKALLTYYALVNNTQIKDKTAVLSVTQRNFLNIRLKLLQEALNLTSIDLQSMTGEITLDEEQQLLKFIFSNLDDMIYLKLIPANYKFKSADSVKDAKKLIKCLFDKAMLKFTTKQMRVKDEPNKRIRILVISGSSVKIEINSTDRMDKVDSVSANDLVNANDSIGTDNAVHSGLDTKKVKETIDATEIVKSLDLTGHTIPEKISSIDLDKPYLNQIKEAEHIGYVYNNILGKYVAIEEYYGNNANVVLSNSDDFFDTLINMSSKEFSDLT